MKNICALIMIIALVSFLGYTVENLWIGLTKGYMDNRNMIFPFLLGYGLAVVGMYIIFGTPRDTTFFHNVSNPRTEFLLYFITIMICISVGEIILGKTVEKFCHIKWWDYSRLPLHITQYTSVFTSMGFTTLIVTFMDKIFVPVYAWYMTWDTTTLAVVAITLMIIMTADFLHSAYLMYTKKTTLERWKIVLRENVVFRNKVRQA